MPSHYYLFFAVIAPPALLALVMFIEGENQVFCGGFGMVIAGPFDYTRLRNHREIGGLAGGTLGGVDYRATGLDGAYPADSLLDRG